MQTLAGEMHLRMKIGLNGNGLSPLETYGILPWFKS